MSNIAIRVERLSKRYEIGIAKHRHGTLRDHIRHDTLRDQLADSFKALFRRYGRNSSDNTFWALQDISLEIHEGDVVGIIGSNGAGKSTLLKILSRITKPTNGQVEIHGRVGSLLEVGTGFHAELTGRENIYLNGAILGMRKAEIDRKFSEIVAFADVERFIETPVKRYSSGMYMRLAFAVAAHLEPEVLLVDEVLAVGDAAFQKKCMGKIGEVADQGRTVLFVSHNMGVVQNLCSRVFVLKAGKLAFAGGANEAVGFYLSNLPAASSSTSHVVDLREAAGRTPKYRQILTRMEIYSEGKPFNGHLGVGGGLSFYLSFELDHQTPNFCMTLVLENRFAQRVLEVSSYYQDIEYPTEEQMPGTHTFLCDIPSFTLLPGQYSVGVVADVDGVAVDRVEGACHINVENSNYYGGGTLPLDGHMVIQHRWHHKMGLPAVTEQPDSISV